MSGSKKVTVGYRLLAGIHYILCKGPIDYISKIRADKKTIWTGRNTGGPISIFAESVFGGHPPEGEGGVLGTVDIEMGEPDQTPNSYLSGLLGDIPAYRGVVGAVLRQVYVSASRYIKPWEFLAQRIHVRQTEGLEQWYDEKAAIYTPVGTEQFLSNVSIDANNASVNPNPPLNGTTFNLAEGDLLIIEFVDGLTYNAWSKWPSDGDAGVPPEGAWLCTFVVRDDTGFDTAYLNDLYPTAELAFAAAKAASPILLQGSTSYTIFLRDDILQNRGGLSVRVSSVESTVDMNPAHIIREGLTDPDFGLAFSDSEIEEAAFVYAADKLHEEGLGLSLIWDGQMEIDEFIQEIARHIDASVDVNLETGAARLKLIRDDYDVDSGLVSIGPDEIDRVEDYNQAAWGEQANSVTVVYEDGPTGEKATVTVSDTAAVQRQGKVVATTVQYPAASNRAVAARLAARDLRALKARVRSCTVYCTRVAASLRMGDVFLLTWPELGYNNAITRVERIDLGDPRSGMVRISAVDDVFALSSESPVASAPPDWTNPAGEALPAPEHLAVEMPYFEAVQRYGQTTVDVSLADNAFLGYLIAAGTRPTGVAHINSTLSVDAGAGYEDSETVDFSPLAYLAGDISFTDTIFPVANEVDIDLVTVGTFAQIANEILVVESIDSDSIVFGRGALDTIPAEYVGSDNLPIFFWDEYGGTDGTEYVDGQSVSVKLLTSTGSNQLAPGSAPIDSFIFDQRAFRPYPPGNLKVNGSYFPETIGGTSELSLTS